MVVHGYILINNEKWFVKVEQRKTRRAITLRKRDEYNGIHVKDVQTFLEQPENRWLVSHLRYSETIFVPLVKP